MTAIAPLSNLDETIIYPSSDGEPVAETYDHLYAIITILEVIRQYLAGRQATVLADQFLYYSQGNPDLRVAPDVMVILDVAPGGRDNYKIWEEGQTPSIVFEITSPATKKNDQTTKQDLYQTLGIQEYWLFDPKGEWLDGQLQGYRLVQGQYQQITDGRSRVLNLQLVVEGKLLGFYRQDTGEKLLIADELAEALEAEVQAKQAEVRAKQEALEQLQREQERADNLQALLARYQEQFGTLDDSSAEADDR